MKPLLPIFLSLFALISGCNKVCEKEINEFYVSIKKVVDTNNGLIQECYEIDARFYYKGNIEFIGQINKYEDEFFLSYASPCMDNVYWYHMLFYTPILKIEKIKWYPVYRTDSLGNKILCPFYVYRNDSIVQSENDTTHYFSLFFSGGDPCLCQYVRDEIIYDETSRWDRNYIKTAFSYSTKSGFKFEKLNSKNYSRSIYVPFTENNAGLDE